MPTNLDRYKKDLKALIDKGDDLIMAIQYEYHPKEVERVAKQKFGDKAEKIIKELPSFRVDYQTWYSEAKILIKQLLPDRLLDFIRYYEKPKTRKSITYENYCIEDYLQDLTITRGYQKEKVVGPDAAINPFFQQLAILKSIEARFESSLFDIQQLLQADVLDTELDAAKELIKNKFVRAAGVTAGVVLERHLTQVCANHNVKVGKRSPGISDLNNALKESNVIDVPQWRFIQHLADIRNLCAHEKNTEPMPEQVNDLVDGVAKVIKTLF